MSGTRKMARRTLLQIGAGAPLLASAISASAGEDAKPPREGEGRLLPVPYYSERSDLDATVACARMALGYFEPDEHFPYSDAAEMVYHREGFWTFEAQLIPILEQKGYRAMLHAATPYAELAAGHVPERYGPEARPRIDREALQWALARLSDNNFSSEPLSFSRALEWLSQGDLVVVAASRSVLRRDPSLPYCRYNLVLTGRAGAAVSFHDPAAGPHRQAAATELGQAFEAPGTDRAVLRVRPGKQSSP
jgi:hypothetical protein